MLQIVKGDLIQLVKSGEFDVIVHGCNCFCRMGSGIARSIAAEWPAVYAADCATVSGDRNKLGSITAVRIDDKFWVVNAYTQYLTARRGENVFELENFEIILAQLLEEFSGLRIGMPCIGAGLANGHWPSILAAITAFAEKHESSGGTVTVVEYQPTE